MSPVILRDGNRPWFAAGASGGRRILAAVTQVMNFVAAFGMDLPRAAHYPRIDVSGPDEVSADHRLPAAVIEALTRRWADAGRRAWRDADQLRLPQRDRIEAGWNSDRNERCGVPLVGGRRAVITILRQQ